VLSKAGILRGRKATIHPAVREMLTDAEYVDERVVVDDKVISSQGPRGINRGRILTFDIHFL
jgi:4-methyl-5(b-hydroxyethyl)-thiazole monophosphate biosynthesis